MHRIGILDIRLFNTDRHAGNILVRRHRGSASELSGEARLAGVDRLIPIDHGFCLPEALEPPYFEWLFWPQVRVPLFELKLNSFPSMSVPHKVCCLTCAVLLSLGFVSCVLLFNLYPWRSRAKVDTVCLVSRQCCPLAQKRWSTFGLWILLRTARCCGRRYPLCGQSASAPWRLVCKSSLRSWSQVLSYICFKRTATVSIFLNFCV